jgi:hypothetical protein
MTAKTKTKITVNDLGTQCNDLVKAYQDLELKTTQLSNQLLTVNELISKNHIESYRELGIRKLELQAYATDNNNRITKIINQFNKLAEDYTVTKRLSIGAICLSIISIITSIVLHYLKT